MMQSALPAPVLLTFNSVPVISAPEVQRNKTPASIAQRKYLRRSRTIRLYVRRKTCLISPTTKGRLKMKFAPCSTACFLLREPVAPAKINAFLFEALPFTEARIGGVFGMLSKSTPTASNFAVLSSPGIPCRLTLIGASLSNFPSTLEN